MLPRIKTVKPSDDYTLDITFDDGKTVIYDVKPDIDSLPGYGDLREVPGFFNNVKLDQSRTCVYWDDAIDLASDSIYEYGKPVSK